MSLPADLRWLRPDSAAQAWQALAPVLPPPLYLAGGTGLAAHLHHRRSRDLDFFFHEPVDLDALAVALRRAGSFAITQRGDDTLSGVFAATPLQVLGAGTQQLLADPVPVAGVPVAAIEDILAMKLKAVGDRGELRDYFDLMAIERQAGRSAEEGLALYLARYRVPAGHVSVVHIVEALGYLDDAADDALLPAGRAEIEGYWRRRQPQIVRHLSRFG